jgi:hypothetical protein
MANYPSDTRLRREARRYLNTLLQLMQLEGSLSAESATGQLEITGQNAMAVAAPFVSLADIPNIKLW